MGHFKGTGWGTRDFGFPLPVISLFVTKVLAQGIQVLIQYLILPHDRQSSVSGEDSVEALYTSSGLQQTTAV